MRVRINPVRAKFLPYFPPWRAGARPASNSLPVVRTRSAMVGFFIGVTGKTAPVRMVAMILFHGKEQWEITVKSQKGEWLNVLISRETKNNKKQVINKGGGKFVTARKTKSKYYLAWNGIRFANSSDLYAIMDRFPIFYLKAEAFVKKEWNKQMKQINKKVKSNG